MNQLKIDSLVDNAIQDSQDPGPGGNSFRPHTRQRARTPSFGQFMKERVYVPRKIANPYMESSDIAVLALLQAPPRRPKSGYSRTITPGPYSLSSKHDEHETPASNLLAAARTLMSEADYEEKEEKSSTPMDGSARANNNNNDNSAEVVRTFSARVRRPRTVSSAAASSEQRPVSAAPASERSFAPRTRLSASIRIPPHKEGAFTALTRPAQVAPFLPPHPFLVSREPRFDEIVISHPLTLTLTLSRSHLDVVSCPGGHHISSCCHGGFHSSFIGPCCRGGR